MTHNDTQSPAPPSRCARKGRFLMWSRSVLPVAQVMAVAAVLLVSTAACGSTTKSVAARAPAPTARATRPSTPATIPFHLGCSPNVRPASSVIWTGPTQRDVALTFDDGPSPDYTATILTTLEQTHTPATFFLVGSNVQQYPALVQREAGDGFTL